MAVAFKIANQLCITILCCEQIALTLYSMELENAFLFDTQRKARLEHILPRVLQELNSRSVNSSAVNAYNVSGQVDLSLA
jgi:hypothetical protein